MKENIPEIKKNDYYAIERDVALKIEHLKIEENNYMKNHASHFSTNMKTSISNTGLNSIMSMDEDPTYTKLPSMTSNRESLM